jgi:hypothetical protein
MYLRDEIGLFLSDGLDAIRVIPWTMMFTMPSGRLSVRAAGERPSR